MSLSQNFYTLYPLSYSFKIPRKSLFFRNSSSVYLLDLIFFLDKTLYYLFYLKMFKLIFPICYRSCFDCLELLYEKLVYLANSLLLYFPLRDFLLNLASFRQLSYRPFYDLDRLNSDLRRFKLRVIPYVFGLKKYLLFLRISIRTF